MKIIQNAENNARLEESMTDDFTEKEAQIYRNRRANVNILLDLAQQRRDLQLKKLEEKVAATNRRLQMSRDSLEGSSAERIKRIEDTYHLDRYHLEQQMAAIEQEQQSQREGANMLQINTEQLQEDLFAQMQMGLDDEEAEDDNEAEEAEEAEDAD